MVATMQSRRQLLTASGVAASIGLAGCLGGGNGDSGGIRYGGGESGSGTFQRATAYQDILSQNSDIEMDVQVTGGVLANLRQTGEDMFDMTNAMTQQMVQAHAEEGEFADEPLSTLPLQGFTSLASNCYYVTPEDSGIETYDDMVGSTVWPLWTGASFRPPFIHVLEEFGIADDVNLADISNDEIAGAVEEGRVDVLGIYLRNHSTLPGYAEQLDATMDLRVVEATEEQRNIMEGFQEWPYEAVDDTGWNQDLGTSEIDSFTASFQHVFHPDVSNDVAYTIVETLVDNMDDINAALDGHVDLTDNNLLTSSLVEDLPIHPGVEDYYNDAGVL